MIPAAQAPLGDFGFPFRTKPPTVASSPNFRELLRFVSTVCIAFQRVKGDRRTFSARAPLLVFQQRRLLLKLSCIFRAFTHAPTRRG